MAVDVEAITEICLDLLGRAPDAIETPGGKSRDSVRVRFAERSVIVTHRKHTQRSKLEALVLRVLSDSEAPVPRLLGWRGDWLLQQDLGAQRLSEVLAAAEPEVVGDLLHQAITGLVHCQRIGTEKHLHKHLPRLGEADDWFDSLFSRAAAVGEALALPPPQLPVAALQPLLRLREARFIKWDARPGNAVVNAQGVVSWIDWEHCGCRNELDDLVWLLADEYTPTTAAVEERLLTTWLPALSLGWELAEARDYFYSYGVLHSLVRLHYILKHKGDGDWWSAEHCLAMDKVGVTREQALRQVLRMRRWALASVHLTGLVVWLDEVEATLHAS